MDQTYPRAIVAQGRSLALGAHSAAPPMPHRLGQVRRTHVDVPRVSGISGAGQGTHDEGFNPAGVFVTPFILRSPAHELRPNPSSPNIGI